MTKKYTTCYMCAGRCGMEITFDADNNIRYVRGNPRHPVNKGVMCAKGNATFMKQASPAKLQTPLLRKPTAERGAGDFVAISWDEALTILGDRLEKIRADDPKKLAYFTGRDQMQAFTGLWATQFGTINWAAHGGFCSVNVASAGLYTLGFSFWEFGEPDWDRAKYFMLWGVAEDHGSNPIKIGISKIKQNGGKFVAINPACTGYQAIADEWLPIKPGTDACLALAMVHVLLKAELIDLDYLCDYTNAPDLVICNPGQANDGLFYRNDAGEVLCFDEKTESLKPSNDPNNQAVLLGEFETKSGFVVKTVMQLVLDKYLDARYSPENASAICGVPAETIRRITLELAQVAFQETIEIKTPWTDWKGRQHAQFVGRPVAMHAMRGVSAHSNGFQTTRAIHLLQMLLGAIDNPGSFRAKAPFPRPIPPGIKPAKQSQANTPLNAPPLGFPTAPEDLVLDEHGNPARIDKAYSWEAPLASHGLMHMVITNAHRGDPYPIDTLLLFMANMAWNSSMNTAEMIEKLCDKDEAGDYKIPFIAVVDAFDSETVKYADLVLPDTTFLERHDTISLLDRPISDPDYVCDSVRLPVVAPDRDVKPWQEVMILLANRLKLPAFTNEDGTPKYKDYCDFIIHFEKSPGIGFLAGYRGSQGEKSLCGEPNPNQWQAYADNEGFFQYDLPAEMRFNKSVNKTYLEFACESGLTANAQPVIAQLYAEPLQKFRLAGRGHYAGPQPKRAIDKARLIKYFDPLPDYYPPLSWQAEDEQAYPFHAITQRPMMMYHSWDSQNAWLRQIVAQNYLYVNRQRGESLGLKDNGWVWVSSRQARIRVQIKLVEACEANTVWTWNAIAKKRGAWKLSHDAPEVKDAFLLNHLISELLPAQSEHRDITNSDPITGQAAWYDLRVNLQACQSGETGFAYEKLSKEGAVPCN